MLIPRSWRRIRLRLRCLQEEEFAIHFLDRNGLRDLLYVIETSSGNTLAVCSRARRRRATTDAREQYALTAMQNLMDLDYGWSNLGNDFILKVVQILSSENSLINVCRPATAILKKLVEADGCNSVGKRYQSMTMYSVLG